MKAVDLAKAAFDGYRKDANNTTYDGKPIPEWEDLTDDVRQHWAAAITSALNALRYSLELSVREIKQVAHAKSYKENFSDAAIPGHNQIILLAKLAESLTPE